jgi:hypothetical protein
MSKIVDSTKWYNNDKSEIEDSTKRFNNDMSEIEHSTKRFKDDVSEFEDSTKWYNNDKSEIEHSTKRFKDDVSEIEHSTNFVLRAIAEMEVPSIKDNLIYELFEKGLMNAMDEYTQNAAGNYTLYHYYSDFLNVINNKNTADEKKEQAKNMLQITDTHILPTQIAVDIIALTKLKAALRKHLLARTKQDMYHNLANELLLLHNNEKCTSTELHNVTGMTTDGFKKHLANIQRLNFIRKQAPLKYVLTEHSKRILLEVFGMRKDEF